MPNELRSETVKCLFEVYFRVHFLKFVLASFLDRIFESASFMTDVYLVWQFVVGLPLVDFYEHKHLKNYCHSESYSPKSFKILSS